MESFSFPPCPWLSYPLFGYVLGRTAALHREVLTSRWTTVLAVLFGFSTVTVMSALALTARGSVLFRYGTMSIGYYLASLAVLAICLAVSLIVCRWRAVKPLIDLVSLGGIRSLAIVPLHYLYIDAIHVLHGPVMSLQEYLALTLLGVFVCFVVSAAIPWLGSKLGALGLELSVSGSSSGWQLRSSGDLWSGVPECRSGIALTIWRATRTLSSVRAVSAFFTASQRVGPAIRLSLAEATRSGYLPRVLLDRRSSVPRPVARPRARLRSGLTGRRALARRCQTPCRGPRWSARWASPA